MRRASQRSLDGLGFGYGLSGRIGVDRELRLTEGELLQKIGVCIPCGYHQATVIGSGYVELLDHLEAHGGCLLHRSCDFGGFTGDRSRQISAK